MKNDKKEVKEEMTKENTLNEAPASATARVKSPNGFSYLFTLRDNTGSELISKLEKFEAFILEKKWSADIDTRGGGFSRPVVPTKPCPFHTGMDMKEKTSKSGEKFYSHSRGVYPNLEYCNGTGFPGEAPVKQTVGQVDYPERQVGEEQF